MRPQILDALSECIRRRDVDFIEQQEPPLPALQKVHKLLRGVRSRTGVRDHAVYRYDDSRGAFSCAGKLGGSISDSTGIYSGQPTGSADCEVKIDICLSLMLVNWINCCFHCWAETLGGGREGGWHAIRERSRQIPTTYDEVQSTSTLFLIVHAAVIPTRVLPAPQGSTMIPDRARLEARQ